MMNNSARRGFRGYIGSREYHGQRVPQHVQNLVVRDYCQRNHMHYLLSATEYHMPGCFIMLEEVVEEIHKLEGIVLYSFFMLPNNFHRRRNFINCILEAGASIHGAVENLYVNNGSSYQQMEDILALTRIVGNETHHHSSFLKELNNG